MLNVALLSLVAIASGVFAPDGTAYPKDLTVWPNAVSHANSDDWLVKHHDGIRLMQPRVLVINFANGFSTEHATKKAEDLMAALRESSRYHGYKDPQAKAFLDYQLYKLVDLTDKEPPAKKLDGNSSEYPRVPNWKEGINFSYGQLFTGKYTALFDIKDPANPAKRLSLAQAVGRGVIHEVWFIAQQGEYGAPYESVEVKQAYDDSGNKIPDKWVQAGNGGSDEQPWIGRSLRILFINAGRGVGCAMESLSHSMEGMAHSNSIPYYRKYFYEYAGFDLDKRWGLPFNSFYPLWGEGKGVSYPDPHTAIVKDGHKTWTLKDYYCIGGNVHFTPNGRGNYDLDNGDAVMSTIEDYRIGSGPDHKDLAKPWTKGVIAQYGVVAPDCMGRWLVYWRQNMPGYKNKSKDDQGKPMKNWFVYLFY